MRYLFALFILLGSAITRAGLAAPNVKVQVSFQRLSEREYRFKIIERGVGPTGPYTRTFKFEATAHWGFIKADGLKKYSAYYVGKGPGSWLTRSLPLGGYAFLYFEGEKQMIEIAFVESWDRYPVRMNINGTHRVSRSSP